MSRPRVRVPIGINFGNELFKIGSGLGVPDKARLELISEQQSVLDSGPDAILRDFPEFPDHVAALGDTQIRLTTFLNYSTMNFIVSLNNVRFSKTRFCHLRCYYIKGERHTTNSMTYVSM